MRKITDFMVEKRYIFLSLFIVLSGICLYLSTKVNINDDIMKYLPPSSETKIGKDIMDKEFIEEDSSILNVMFKDLSEKEKEDTLKKLKDIEGVSSVDYDSTSTYNQKDYTLYVLNVDDYDHSKTATNVYNTVKNHFHVAGMSGSIYEENKPILQLWIVVIAVICAMIILTILSDSYLEPWLYLLSIGIAIFINKGTNLMFDSVSEVTNSITAILQLALSMDYSIMLSNRYKQEKENGKNKIEAMKEALYQSFKAISSSSVTTIVGLIALVFMSFTIGKDLGFVLAKGVLLSLISIFFCLPALLLLCDNWIAKTKKKTPKFNLTQLGKFIYKTRFIQTGLIVVLFITAFFLKGNIGILFTASEQDKVGKVFPATNQIAIVYQNQYEELLQDYCKELEQDEKIDQVLCYSNTINEKLAYDQLKGKLKDLGQEIEMEDYLIKVIYYHYYRPEEQNKMTLEEFITFLKSDIYPNGDLNHSLDEEIKENVELLTHFSTLKEIEKKRTLQEISDILGMDMEDAESILIYYYSKKENTTLTIKEFVDFMLEDVAKDPKYSASLDSETLAKLKKLKNFTDTTKMKTSFDEKELSKIFGIEEDRIKELFLFYRTQKESTTKLTLREFATMALEMSKQPSYANFFKKDMILSLNQLLVLTSDEKYEIEKMDEILQNIDVKLSPATLELLYTYYTGAHKEKKLTLKEFANIALEMSKNDTFASSFEGKLNSLTILASYDQNLPKETLYQMFGITDTISIQFLNQNLPSEMTPKDFVSFLLSNNLATGEQKESLLKVQSLMQIANTAYTTKEIANVLGMDDTVSTFVFGFSEKNSLMDISLKDLILFVYEQKENPYLANYFTQDFLTVLSSSYQIVTLANNRYSYLETTNLLRNMANVSEKEVSMIFGIYDYYHQKTTMTPFDLTNLILENQDNDLLKGKLSEEEKRELSIAATVMNSSLKNKKYDAQSLSTLLSINEDTIRLLFGLENFQSHNQSSAKISLWDFVQFITSEVMNTPDYSSRFDEEKKEKLTTLLDLMNHVKNKTEYTSKELYRSLSKLSSNLDSSLFDLVYMYYGSCEEYDSSWTMTIETFVNYLNSDILSDSRFNDFLSEEKKETILNSKDTVSKAKKLLVSNQYSRAVLNTKYEAENEETYDFIHSIQDRVGNKEDIYVVGNSAMAVEMSKTFDKELNKITLLTMIFIFIVVAFTFKDLIIPFVLVLIIQTAVYITMSAISLTSGSEYFIALLIVQAILMGATIDYAIVYTSYYRESRLTMGIKDSIINAYNRSIHTIISSSSILIIVTLIVANFASAIAAKICETISQGTFASVLLILFILPGVLATSDKFICRKGYYVEKNKKKAN